MQGVHMRKYGASATINFELYNTDGVNFNVAAVHALGDTKVMTDEGVEANTTNAFTDEGQGYSIVLTATEMQAARIVLYVVDQGAKAWLDKAVVIETYGHASAQHAMDFDDSVRGGMTALPNAAADAAGGLAISDAGGLDIDGMNTTVNTTNTTIGVAGAGLTGLGGMSATMKGEVNTEVDAALNTAVPGSPTVNSVNDLITKLEARLTALRAGYLDNLNVGGLAASLADVQAIQNNTRTTIAAPGAMERPDSGSTRFKLYLNNYDTMGNMEEPDSAPTVAVVNEEGTARSANLQHPTTHVAQTTMVQLEAGRYWIEYDMTAASPIEGLVFTFTVIEGGATRKFNRVAQIVDTTAVDFTAADRTTLGNIATGVPNIAPGTNGGLATVDASNRIAGIAGTKNTLDALNDLSQALVNAEVDTALADIHLDHLLAVDYDPAVPPGVATALFNELIENNAGVSRYTAAALAQAPAGGGGLGETQLRANTAQAGAASTITLDAGASAVDDYYKHAIIALTGGTGAGQSQIVNSYVGSTKVATMAAAWATAPDATTTFVILPLGTIPGATAPSAATVATTVWAALQSANKANGSMGVQVNTVVQSVAPTKKVADKATGETEVFDSDGVTSLYKERVQQGLTDDKVEFVRV